MFMKKLISIKSIGAIRMIAASFAFLALACNAPGQPLTPPLSYEGFDYSGITLHNQNGGTGWTNAWQDTDNDAPLSNDGTSLAFPANVTFTPVGARLYFAGAGEAERRFAVGMPLTDEGKTYYFSALVRRQGDFRIEFIDNSTNVRWRMGASGADGAVAGVTGDYTVSGIFPMNETVFIIGKMLTHASANDQVFMNVYRATDVVPAIEPTTWQVTTNGGSGVTLVRLQIRNISAAPLEVDEIRIGTNYESVAGVPLTSPPIIQPGPSEQTGYEGWAVQLQVNASGASPLYFQWYKAEQPVQGANSSTLILTNLQLSDAGVYSAVVSNAYGVATSAPITLIVIPITNITVGLQALWHLDETSGLVASDSSTNNNHGALNNFPDNTSHWVAGRINGGLSFNGANYVQVPDAPSIGARLVRGFTVAAWFKSDVALTTNGNTYRMFEKGDNIFFLQGDGNPANVGVGGMNFAVKRNNQIYTASIGIPLEAGRWYHLAGIFDGQEIRAYLNGQLMGTKYVGGDIDDDHLPLRIGSDDSGKYFRGVMDEVGIWDRPLGQSEIDELAGLNGPPTFINQPAGVTVYAGATVALSALASGRAPLFYQWLQDGLPLPNATNTTLTILNTTPANAGNYTLVASNDLGATTSEVAVVNIIPITSIYDGAAVYYPLNELGGSTAVDASGNNRNGALIDYALPEESWVYGQMDGALAFDGVSNRVLISASSSMDLGQEATFAFWINPNTYGTLENYSSWQRSFSRILSKGSYFDIYIVDDPGTVRQTISARGVNAPESCLKTNEWQHFAIVYRAGTVAFYKNGFPLGAAQAGTLGPSNSLDAVMGCLNTSTPPTNLFNGLLDEVGIWARPLSDTEILSLVGIPTNGPPIQMSTLESAERFEGGSVTFSISVGGERPVTYTWLRNGTPLPESNTNLIVLTNLTVADSGQYTVVISNALGVITATPPATLTVLQPASLLSGLAAYWPFDETTGDIVLDYSGQQHHGWMSNFVVDPSVRGVVRGAVDFDGVDNFIVVPHDQRLDNNDQVTVSFWLNPRTLSFGGGVGRVLRKESNLDVALESPTARIQMYGWNKAISASSNNVLVANQWQHFAIVYKTNSIRFYKNGQLIGVPVTYRPGPPNTFPLIIGNFGPNLSINRLFNGYMDEVAIWKRALSDAEVQAVYQLNLQGQPLLSTPVSITRVNDGAALRLVFQANITSQNLLLEWRPLVNDGQWLPENSAVFTPLGSGLMEAVFNRPATPMGFYRLLITP